MHHVLVVDDDADICDVLKQGFETNGHYRVSCATTKEDAFAALNRAPLDLALLDVLMHENAGREIEALAWDLRVPVIRMSGHPDILLKSREQGIPILAKPFGLGDLVVKVDRLLVEAQRLQQRLDAHLGTARDLIRRTQANLDAVHRAWEETSRKWQDVCRVVLEEKRE